MPNNQAFQEKIIELQKLVQLFSKNYNSDIDTDFKELNEQLLGLSKVTIPLIKSFTKKAPRTGNGIYDSAPNGESETSDIDSDTDDTCTITNTRTLEPVEYKGARRFVLPKGSIIFEIETSTSTCSIDDLEKKIVFSNGNEVPADFNIINREGKKIKASVPIDFTGQVAAEGERLSAEVKIKYHSTESISYIPSASVKTSTDKETEDTIENFVRWSKTISVDGSPSPEQIMSICPTIKITKNSVLAADLEKELDKIPFVLKMQAADLKTLDFATLESAAKEALSIFHNILKKLLSAVGYYNDILNGLGALAYPSPKENETADEKLARETKLAKANKGLKSEYDKQCANSRKLLDTINSKMTLVSDIRTLIISELIAKSIPEDLVTQSNALKEIKTAQDLVLKPLVDEVYGYYSKATALDSFEEWKAMLDRINPICDQLQTAWDTPWNALNTAIATYETSNPEGAKNKYYKQWKKSDYNSLTFHLHSQKGPVLSDIDNIKSYLKNIQEVVDQTGGDGILEYVLGEDTPSEAESDRFSINTIGSTPTVTNLDFEDTGKPLFENGATGSDVKQGLVGDCYLMSALISLTKDNQDLIQNMIVPSGDEYIVTLHKEGIPVEVVVNKNILIREITTADPNIRLTYEKMPAAKAINDLWVPIIEKAYAKLFGQTLEDPGGDLMAIEGGTSDQALKALLGNRVSTPNKIYLDASDVITENEADGQIEVPNPMYFNTGNPNHIRRVIQAAHNANYEIHISSPDEYTDPTTNLKYKLTDNDIVPLGNGNYISFNHAYSLLNATDSNVTIRNPHGDSNQEQGLFSDQVKRDIVQLITAIDAIETAFTITTPFISNAQKESMDSALNTVIRNQLIQSQFQYAQTNWNEWLERIIPKAEDNIWIPKKDKQKLLKSLREDIIALKTSIHNTADKEHRSTGGQKLSAGFVCTTIHLSAEQTISYPILQQFFQRATISIIR